MGFKLALEDPATGAVAEYWHIMSQQANHGPFPTRDNGNPDAPADQPMQIIMAGFVSKAKRDALKAPLFVKQVTLKIYRGGSYEQIYPEIKKQVDWTRAEDVLEA